MARRGKVTESATANTGTREQCQTRPPQRSDGSRRRRRENASIVLVLADVKSGNFKFALGTCQK